MRTSPGLTSSKKSCSMHRLLPAIPGGKSRKKKHPVLLCGLPSSWTRHLVLLQLWDCRQATLCLSFLIWKGKRLTTVTFQRHYEDEMCPSAVSEHINSLWALSPCNVRLHVNQHIRACSIYGSNVLSLAHGSLIEPKGSTFSIHNEGTK